MCMSAHDWTQSNIMWHRSGSTDARTKHLKSYLAPQSHWYLPKPIFDLKNSVPLTMIESACAPERARLDTVYHYVSQERVDARKRNLKLYLKPQSHQWHRSASIDARKRHLKSYLTPQSNWWNPKPTFDLKSSVSFIMIKSVRATVRPSKQDRV